MNADRNLSYVDELILQKLEGTITRGNYERLMRLLEQDRELADYYIEFTLLYAALSEPGKIVFDGDVETIDRESYNCLFAQLAEDEKKAVAFSPVCCPETPALIEGVRERKKKYKVSRQVSRFNIWFTFSAMAAMLIVMWYVVHYPRSVPMAVATLTDTIDARWSAPGVNPPGMRFTNVDAPHTLVSGFAKITFDYGAEVVVEGPAEFSFLSPEKVHLHYGRLFARVPSRAVGFTVDMPGGSVIDLGTEFGVVARMDGADDVKLFSGSASLLAGQQGTRRSSQLLIPGQAARIIGHTGEVQDVTLDSHAFARRIDSASGIVWKGQPIDLADIVGGGNGLGTGVIETAINPLTGLRGGYFDDDRHSDNRFVAVTADRYIDGVFVPSGATAQVVSSRGDVFEDCPVTIGLFYTEIINGTGKYIGDFSHGVPLGELGGKHYGTETVSGLFMHANLGITYDLEAIRGDFPEFAMCTFTAEAGLSTAAPRKGNADIWVLVDGQVRFCQRGVTDKGKAYPIDIPLRQTDRFLTLIVTDGGDVDVPTSGSRATDSDWCVFMQPRLSAAAGEKE